MSRNNVFISYYVFTVQDTIIVTIESNISYDHVSNYKKIFVTKCNIIKPKTWGIGKMTMQNDAVML